MMRIFLISSMLFMGSTASMATDRFIWDDSHHPHMLPGETYTAHNSLVCQSMKVGFLAMNARSIRECLRILRSQCTEGEPFRFEGPSDNDVAVDGEQRVLMAHGNAEFVCEMFYNLRKNITYMPQMQRD
jgi:hypothetical protein